MSRNEPRQGRRHACWMPHRTVAYEIINEKNRQILVICMATYCMISFTMHWIVLCLISFHALRFSIILYTFSRANINIKSKELFFIPTCAFQYFFIWFSFEKHSQYVTENSTRFRSCGHYLIFGYGMKIVKCSNEITVVHIFFHSFSCSVLSSLCCRSLS